MTGLATISWGGRRFFRQGELTDKYKMLNLRAVSNLAPIRWKNEILSEMAQLLYAIRKDQSINLLSLILTEMMKGCNVNRNSLPFSTLVTEICLDYGVQVRPQIGVQKVMGPLKKASFQRSQGHSGCPAARQDEPLALGINEV